jgi:hypothetical protein
MVLCSNLVFYINFGSLSINKGHVGFGIWECLSVFGTPFLGHGGFGIWECLCVFGTPFLGHGGFGIWECLSVFGTPFIFIKRRF